MNERNRGRWSATSETDRNRKHIHLTLPEAALEKLTRLGKRYGSRSAAVEHLIVKEEEPPCDI